MSEGDQSTPVAPNVQTWRGLYKAALLENDKQKLPECIYRAQTELIRRARELFTMHSGNFEEEQAIDQALRASLLRWRR